MNRLLLFGQEITPIRKLLLMRMVAGGGGLNEYEVTGNPAVFNTNVEKPLTQLLIPFTPIQSGTGDPSPSNVRPITGWTGVTINHSGEDTSDPTTYPVTFPAMGKNLIRDTVRKVQNAYTVYVGSENAYDTFLKAGTYTFSVETYNDVKVDGHVTQEDGTRYYPFSRGSNPYTGSGSFTLTEDAWVKLNVYSSSGIDLDNIGHCQVEAGQTATTYEPYTNTVYGGSLDVVTGELSVEWVAKDLGEYNWQKSSSGNKFYVLSAAPYYPMEKDLTMYCSTLKFDGRNVNVTDFYGADGTIRYYYGVGSTAHEFYVHDERYSNASDFKNAMSGVPLVYPLATPITYQLTPQQINTLIGDNTIWSDTNGENTIKYLKRG